MFEKMLKSVGRVLMLVSLFVVSLARMCVAGPIHDAAKTGDLALVHELVKGNPQLVNARNEDEPDRKLPLHYAAEYGRTEVIDFLVKSGAEPDKFDKYGISALHCAVIANNTAGIKSLLKNGADKELKSFTQGLSPLNMASVYGNLDALKILIDAGTDLKSQADVSKNTPMHNGVKHLKILEYLLQKKCDPNVRNMYNATPLHIACQRSAYVESVKALLKAKANPNARTVKGQTPLHLAVERFCVTHVSLLLSAGANPGLTDNAGKTPLAIVLDFEKHLEPGCDAMDDWKQTRKLLEDAGK